MRAKKNGIFTSPVLALFAFTLLSLQGCASFLELGSREDSTEYDRGYMAEADEESGECSGRACNTEASGRRAPASMDAADPETDFERRRIRDAIDTRDVVLGMSRSDVMASWGQPVQREVAGRSASGHERWVYGSRYSLNGSRTVIFENGKVAGWSH